MKRTPRQQAMIDMTASGISIEVLVKERIILEITSTTTTTIRTNFHFLSGPTRKKQKRK